MADEKQKSNGNKKLLIIILLLLLLLIGGGITVFALFANQNSSGRGESETGLSSGTIPYETNIGIIKPGQNLSEILKEDAENRIPLQFATNAVSSNGVDFVCKLGNPEGAIYDVYFDMYTDADFTDQIYLSGLVPPGSQIESFTTNRTFPQGNTEIVLVITQVADDHKTITGQVPISLTLVVK